MKENKNGKRLKLFLMATSIIAIGAGALFAGDRIVKPRLMPSPFDGNQINLDVNELNERVVAVYEVIKPQMSTDEIKKYVAEHLSQDEKKNALLLYALQENPFVSNEEERAFAGFIQYANDNKHLDYERIYRTFRTVWILKSQSLSGATEAEYSPLFNIIRIEELSALYHELFHLEDHGNYKYNGEVQDWFIEGYTEVLKSEYVGIPSNAYSAESSVIRIITEIIGRENMFMARGSKGFDVVVNALLEKGVEKKTLDELLYNLNEYSRKNTAYLKYDDVSKTEIEEHLRKTSDLLVEVYNQVYNYPEVVNPRFVYNLELFNKKQTLDLKKVNYYLFNGALLNRYPVMTTNEKDDLLSIESNGVVKERPAYFYDEYKDNALLTHVEFKDTGKKGRFVKSFTQRDLEPYQVLNTEARRK